MTETKLRPVDLRRMAGAVASNYGDRGAIVISVGEDGVRIGTQGLTPTEQREALAVAMHYTFVFEPQQREDESC